MSSSKIVYGVHDRVALIELNDPPANTYSYEMMREIDEAILSARMDPSVHAIVITGSGDRFFCAGANIGMLAKADAQWKYYFCLHANETLSRWIARRGAGKIGLPEVMLGVLPGTGGTQRLARLLGKSRAIELMATGRLMTFDEALAIGLVNEVWEESRLGGRAFRDVLLDYARQFTPPERASRAVGRIKRAVQSGLDVGLADGLALERELQQLLFEGEDAKEGLRANLDKRPPRFTGD
jgi:enoyl-CoA hydratase/carnithine racemase